jgi:periplasmic protein TonB
VSNDQKEDLIMFETSVVRERVVAQRRAGVFAASIAAHTFVIAGVVAASIGSVSFPKAAPNETLPFIAVPPPDLPLPRGNPNVPRHPQPPAPQQPAHPAQQQTAPPEITTPAVIPNSIPVLTGTTGETSTSGTPTGATGERWGSPNGDPNAIDIGQSAASPNIGMPNVIYQPGVDVKPATVLVRVQPVYPRAGIAGRLPGWVVVKCVVGKTGEIRDAEIVKSSMSMFDQPALDALRQWKFAPGYFHGQAVDTYFELKITFEVR